MRTVFLISALLSVPAFAGAPAHFDPPDLRFELELHRQYLRQRGLEADTPTLAKDAYIETYKIRPGDSLWSLSRMLYGDGGYWPRVWAQNRSITNPHLIRPGHALQFLLGSEDDTPAFRFTEDDDQDAGLELAASNSGPIIEIPPPEVAPRPVLKIPPSFPEWQNVYRPKPRALIDDRGIKAATNKVLDRIFLRSWVEEKEIDPVGYFLENDTEAGLPVVNQYVFIKMKKGLGHIGQKLLIAHQAGKIRTVNDEFDNDVPAYLIQVAGELEITEGAPAEFRHSRDRENFDAFRALITRTTGLAVTDNVLIPGQLTMVDVSSKGVRGTAVAQVIGSEHHVASMLFGQGDIVFLNKGSDAGIEVGQILDLYGNRRTRHAGTPVVFSPAASGTVKIVHVSGKLSTAVILTAHDGIMQGDKVQEVSSRREVTEKLDDAHLTPIEGGEVTSGDDDFNLDESDIENEVDSGENF
jgi:hypothetical protein